MIEKSLMSRKINLNLNFQNFKEYQKHNHNNENILVVSKNLVSNCGLCSYFAKKSLFLFASSFTFSYSPSNAIHQKGLKMMFLLRMALGIPQTLIFE